MSTMCHLVVAEKKPLVMRRWTKENMRLKEPLNVHHVPFGCEWKKATCYEKVVKRKCGGRRNLRCI